MLHSIACDFGRKTETMNFDITKKPKILIHDLKNIFAISQILTVLKHGDLQRIVEEKIKTINSVSNDAQSLERAV